ncbi:hypothetical protein K3495_g5130 [Podosphaera aphanis]|nr:hypothetical protein K3495_g5130 [Podosphaera aphanis]
MFSPPIPVNALVNDTVMIQASVDNSCLCTGVINEKLANKLKLQRIAIKPRPLVTAETATSNKPIINSVVSIMLDLDGYITRELRLCVVPRCSHQLILGKRWLEDQDAVILAKDQCLQLRKLGESIQSSIRWQRGMRHVQRPKAMTVEELTDMLETVPVCKASIEDISKALQLSWNYLSALVL